MQPSACTWLPQSVVGDSEETARPGPPAGRQESQQQAVRFQVTASPHLVSSDLPSEEVEVPQPRPRWTRLSGGRQRSGYFRGRLRLLLCSWNTEQVGHSLVSWLYSWPGARLPRGVLGGVPHPPQFGHSATTPRLHLWSVRDQGGHQWYLPDGHPPEVCPGVLASLCPVVAWAPG